MIFDVWMLNNPIYCVYRSVHVASISIGKGNSESVRNSPGIRPDVYIGLSEPNHCFGKKAKLVQCNRCLNYFLSPIA